MRFGTLAAAALLTFSPFSQANYGVYTNEGSSAKKCVQAITPDEDEFSILIGASAAMVEVRRDIALFAPSNLPILIVGETGTGKELVAQEIHEKSKRKGKKKAVGKKSAAKKGARKTVSKKKSAPARKSLNRKKAASKPKRVKQPVAKKKPTKKSAVKKAAKKKTVKKNPVVRKQPQKLAKPASPATVTATATLPLLSPRPVLIPGAWPFPMGNKP